MGRLSSRNSTARDSWDRASTGTFRSLAMAFSPWVISVISCTRLVWLWAPVPRSSCR